MTERVDVEGLLPCPFCGEAPTVGVDDTDVGCGNGECILVASERGTLEASIAAWNRRASPPSLLAEVAALRAENERMREALEPFAKIEVPEGAADGAWVATTAYCGDQVTAHSVRRARAALAAQEPR